MIHSHLMSARNQSNFNAAVSGEHAKVVGMLLIHPLRIIYIPLSLGARRSNVMGVSPLARNAPLLDPNVPGFRPRIVLPSVDSMSSTLRIST